jgi:hypothetical protein
VVWCPRRPVSGGCWVVACAGGRCLVERIGAVPCDRELWLAGVHGRPQPGGVDAALLLHLPDRRHGGGGEAAARRGALWQGGAGTSGVDTWW